MKKQIIITAIISAASFALGRWSVAKPFIDIDNDPRGCRLEWDDGEVIIKSRTISLGTLQPGESKNVKFNH